MSKTEPAGLLLAMMDPGTVTESELNEWYDEEHIPERLVIKGVLHAERWVSLRKSPKYLAIYDLKNPSVLQSEAYIRLGKHLSDRTKRVLAGVANFRRQVFRQITPGAHEAPAVAGGLLVVELECDLSLEAESNDWYDTEHYPMCMAVPGVVRGRRFAALEGSPLYLALYHLEAPEVARDPAWTRALETPWSRRMQPALKNLTVRVYQAYQRS